MSQYQVPRGQENISKTENGNKEVGDQSNRGHVAEEMRRIRQSNGKNETQRGLENDIDQKTKHTGKMRYKNEQEKYFIYPLQENRQI